MATLRDAGITEQRRNNTPDQSTSRAPSLVPVAMLLGALLVLVADTLGKTLISPAQLPAGLMVALVGAPYFVWLLRRSRG